MLENQRARAVFSSRDGGRWLEYVWKDTGTNLLPENGVLAGVGPVVVRRGTAGWCSPPRAGRRTVTLAGASALTVEQSGPLPAETLQYRKAQRSEPRSRRECASRAVYTLRK